MKHTTISIILLACYLNVFSQLTPTVISTSYSGGLCSTHGVLYNSSDTIADYTIEVNASNSGGCASSLNGSEISVGYVHGSSEHYFRTTTTPRSGFLLSNTLLIGAGGPIVAGKYNNIDSVWGNSSSNISSITLSEVNTNEITGINNNDTITPNTKYEVGDTKIYLSERWHWSFDYHIDGATSSDPAVATMNLQVYSNGNFEGHTVDFSQLDYSIGVLPVTLITFNVEKNNDYATLIWQTATEINNDFFTVEKSQDGINWREVAKIQGEGNSSSVVSYSYNDDSPFSGVSYYRLKQTDFNGQYDYSMTRSINFNTNQVVTIYPNPSNSLVNILGETQELEQIRVFNLLGEEVSAITEIQKLTENSILLNLSNLSAGVYFVKTKTTTNKLKKQ